MNTATDRYTGDVTLSGSLSAPVSMRNPDDLFVMPAGVTDSLVLHNPEAVFTHGPIESSASSIEPASTVEGNLEDGYVESEGVTGSLVVSDAEDVFVPASGAPSVTVTGAETTYTDESIDVEPPTSSTTTGWRESAEITDPADGITVTGAKHSISVTDVTGEITVYAVGYGHEISVSGRGATVDVIVLGYDNEISIGPRASVGETTLTGFDNSIEEAPFPVSDLIETTKQQACRNAGFGRSKVTFQEPATDESWCQNCGSDASAIIERHQLDAWFVFGYPLKVFGKSMNPAHECEECAVTVEPGELSEAERKNLLG